MGVRRRWRWSDFDVGPESLTFYFAADLAFLSGSEVGLLRASKSALETPSRRASGKLSQANL